MRSYHFLGLFFNVNIRLNLRYKSLAMKLIKLDAIDSTNNFLKELAREQLTQNFTVVTAETQTNGKGQMGAQWSSEHGKNIIMSILTKDFLFNVDDIFDLNIITSLSVIEALEEYSIPDLSIKWPNDIMSGNKKIGGILIENIIKNDCIYSIVGLGLNVNQTNFKNLPKASSLAAITNNNFNRVDIQKRIVNNLKNSIFIFKKSSGILKQNYIDKLFKKGVSMPFLYENGETFSGTIQGVNKLGAIEILHSDNSIKLFNLKEIQLLY